MSRNLCPWLVLLDETDPSDDVSDPRVRSLLPEELVAIPDPAPFVALEGKDGENGERACDCRSDGE